MAGLTLEEHALTAFTLDADGDVIAFDVDTWAQHNEMCQALGKSTRLPRQMNRRGHSAYAYKLSILDPLLTAASWRLWGADCAEWALNNYGGSVDPRSRKAVRVARAYAHGRATGVELAAARASANAAARAAAWTAANAAAAAGDAAWAARDEARAAAKDHLVARLLQYVDHGEVAETMPWPMRGGQDCDC